MTGASSLCAIEMVSLMAVTSSVMSFLRAAYSVSFAAQFFARFALIVVSSARGSCVSSASAAFVAIAITSSLERAIFGSMPFGATATVWFAAELAVKLA